MKPKHTLLLCVLSALLILGDGLYFLLLSPSGVFQQNGPEEYMQSLLDSSSPEDWAARIGPVWNKEVSEFEAREEIFRLSFGTAARGDFRFREYEPVFRRRSPVYILSSGDVDLCLLSLTHGKDGWAVGEITVPEDLLAPETRTVSVLAPAGSEIFVNGLSVSAEYLRDDFVPYEDMQPLEGRFDAVPHRERWEIPGLYEAPEIVARLNGADLPLHSRQGEDYGYMPPDARSYSFRFLAPGDAVVTVNGAELTAEDSLGDMPLPLELNVSEEQQTALPPYRLYGLEGLYSQPEITVTVEGRELAPVVWVGETVYPPLSPSAPEEELQTLVETYLRNYCHFGAHLYGYNMLLPYVVEQGELWNFHINAQASLQWIVGEQLDIHELRVFDWLALGEDLSLCSAHVSCTTVTAYETKELELDYQLLCVRTEKGWRLQDMAYQ